MTCNYFSFWWWCWHVWSVASILPKIIQEKYDLYSGLVYSLYINSSNWMRNHMFNQHYSERSTLLLHVFSEMIIVTDEKQDVFSDERIQCKVNLSIQHWMHFSAEWHKHLALAASKAIPSDEKLHVTSKRPWGYALCWCKLKLKSEVMSDWFGWALYCMRRGR